MNETTSYNWISVSEQLPETSDDVLVLVQKLGYINKIVCVGSYGKIIDSHGNISYDKYWNIKQWDGENLIPKVNIHKVTHWMPIPKKHSKSIDSQEVKNVE